MVSIFRSGLGMPEGMKNPGDPHIPVLPQAGASQPLYVSGDLAPRGFCYPVFWNEPHVLFGGVGKVAESQ